MVTERFLLLRQEDGSLPHAYHCAGLMTRIGVITGSGTYALPRLRRRLAARGRHPLRPRRGSPRASSPASRSSTSRATGRATTGSPTTSTTAPNVTALKEAGVDAVIGITVCGACDPSLELGTLVVFDDLHFLVNRLPDGQICTLYDTPGEPGRGHWIFEGPFSAAVRAALLDGAREAGHTVRDGGCYGHVDGPRFNTRTEIGMLSQVGVTAVSQTAGPETVLCGEAELPYALIGYATDYANGVQDEPTPVETLMRLIGASGETFATTLTAAVPRAAAAEHAPVGTHFRF
jgi:purine nucleoside phosphorylase